MCEKCDKNARLLGYRDSEHLRCSIADLTVDTMEQFRDQAVNALDIEVRHSRITEHEKYFVLQTVDEAIAAALVAYLSSHVDTHRLDPAAVLRELAVLMERDQDKRLEKKLGIKVPANTAPKNYSVN